VRGSGELHREVTLAAAEDAEARPSSWRSLSQVCDVRWTEIATSGGSSETGMHVLIAIPTSLVAERAATATTPLGNAPKASLSVAAPRSSDHVASAGGPAGAVVGASGTSGTTWDVIRYPSSVRVLRRRLPS
jgi:hypothetical protein